MGNTFGLSPLNRLHSFARLGMLDTKKHKSPKNVPHLSQL